jgi:hypothetical protein
MMAWIWAETCCDITWLIKHTETLLWKKDSCTYSLLLRNRMHSPIIKIIMSY